MDFDKNLVCYKCGKPFENEIDWEARHSDDEGEDIHEKCCVMCDIYDQFNKQTHPSTTKCFKCGTLLTPEGPRNNETTYQFDNALWLGLFGGYGMFVDNMTDFEPRDSVLKGSDYECVLCHDCAHQFMDDNPWLKKLFHPYNTHAHTKSFTEANPDHFGWDYAWEMAKMMTAVLNKMELPLDHSYDEEIHDLMRKLIDLQIQKEGNI